MDQMLPSPSFNIPSIGTPHHAIEEDQMINPSAAAAQQHHQGLSGATPGGSAGISGPTGSHKYSFGGFTPAQSLLRYE